MQPTTGASDRDPSPEIRDDRVERFRFRSVLRGLSSYFSFFFSMSKTDVTAAIFVFQNNKNGGHFDLPMHLLLIFNTNKNLKLFFKRVIKSL